MTTPWICWGLHVSTIPGRLASGPALTPSTFRAMGTTNTRPLQPARPVGGTPAVDHCGNAVIKVKVSTKDWRHSEAFNPWVRFQNVKPAGRS